MDLSYQLRNRVGMMLFGAVASLAMVVAAPPSKFSVSISLKRRPFRHPQSTRILLSLRGGSTDPSSSENYPPSQQYQAQEYQQQQQPHPEWDQPPGPPPGYDEYQQQTSPTNENVMAEEPPAIPNTGEDVPFQEAFQDRIDNWRTYQLEHAEEQRSSLSPRDEQGRMKLLTSATKATRAFTFFLLMWRNVHLYEVVDQKLKGYLRYAGVFPLTFLFIANMAGVVASLTSSSHSSKKRLKAILNLDKLMELYLIVWHIGKLLFSTSNLVPREIYISHILHSVFFVIQCQTVTRFVWDEALHVAQQPSGTYRDQDYGDSNDDDQTIQQQQQQQQMTGSYAPQQQQQQGKSGPYRY